MKAVVQKVVSASASYEGEVISSIGKGLCILLGIYKTDTTEDMNYLIRKILNMKVFEAEGAPHGRWSKSVKDLDYEVLCLSQITLCHMFKGNKLDFHHAMPPKEAEPFYQKFIEEMRKQHQPNLVKEGAFGKYIVVNIANDGPVTVYLNSRETKPPPQPCAGDESSVLLD